MVRKEPMKTITMFWGYDTSVNIMLWELRRGKILFCRKLEEVTFSLNIEWWINWCLPSSQAGSGVRVGLGLGLGKQLCLMNLLRYVWDRSVQDFVCPFVSNRKKFWKWNSGVVFPLEKKVRAKGGVRGVSLQPQCVKQTEWEETGSEMLVRENPSIWRQMMKAGELSDHSWLPVTHS